ncbi:MULTISPECIES: NADH-quinone oxidoreductase subunit J [Kordiimonas]|uniref:NADH-quinone oxidoreductase subunit J n=1 Tax=Kordiimonas lacus TaxID=637679 RepID=A0A1G6WCE4_9PROT|nr:MULTISPECIES: NADH-quinone oxidoreductase subunit J [Kordiimonas]SDD62735.1 NADH dehydrogenase subunit J [Kordiimonas lacus]
MDFSSMLPVAAFWLFASITILSGLLVILAKNPVHSVLWLILAFFSAAGLFVLMGAEFLAMLLVIVYVGAVAVLFLFVVMMLDINFVELRQGIMQNAPIGVVVGLVLLAELGTLGAAWHFGDDVAKNAAAPTPVVEQVENTAALGNIIYTDYIFIFQMSGLILLVAMIGAIVLTHRTRPGVRRQDVSKQNARRPEDAYELVDVEVGKGVALPTKKG